MYNTPCYLLPSGSTTTSTATPPYLPSPPCTYLPSRTSTPLLPTPTIVHHLAATPQPVPYFAFTGTVKPQQSRQSSGRFSSLRCVFWKFERKTFFDWFCHRRPSLERCLQVIGAHRFLHFLVHWSALYSHVVNPEILFIQLSLDNLIRQIPSPLDSGPDWRQPRPCSQGQIFHSLLRFLHLYLLYQCFDLNVSLFCCDWPRPSLAFIEETTYCCHKNLWILNIEHVYTWCLNYLAFKG